MRHDSNRTFEIRASPWMARCRDGVGIRPTASGPFSPSMATETLGPPWPAPEGLVLAKFSLSKCENYCVSGIRVPIFVKDDVVFKWREC